MMTTLETVRRRKKKPSFLANGIGRFAGSMRQTATTRRNFFRASFQEQIYEQNDHSSFRLLVWSISFLFFACRRRLVVMHHTNGRENIVFQENERRKYILIDTKIRSVQSSTPLLRLCASTVFAVHQFSLSVSSVSVVVRRHQVTSSFHAGIAKNSISTWTSTTVSLCGSGIRIVNAISRFVTRDGGSTDDDRPTTSSSAAVDAACGCSGVGAAS